MQFMSRPISPVELTKFGMRSAQALLIYEKWGTEEPAKIRTTKPEWWDSVNHYGYGYQPFPLAQSEGCASQ